LKNLKFLAVMKNPELTTVPECIADLPSLMFLNLKESPNAKIPSSITEKGEEMQPGMWDLGG
jgi:Leucine-rich repeat (LRR) protein